MQCVPRYIRISELARLAGVTTYYIRKWTHQGLIPHSQRAGERILYPSDEALDAIRQILQPQSAVEQISENLVAAGEIMAAA